MRPREAACVEKHPGAQGCGSTRAEVLRVIISARDHKDAMQTHNGIREARLDLLDTMGVGIPNYYKRVNNPKM